VLSALTFLVGRKKRKKGEDKSSLSLDTITLNIDTHSDNEGDWLKDGIARAGNVCVMCSRHGEAKEENGSIEMRRMAREDIVYLMGTLKEYLNFLCSFRV
jgi:hypothetical protein